MYLADRSALGAIGSPFVMVFPMNEIFHFSQQLSRSQFTGSRWQCIGPFPVPYLFSAFFQGLNLYELLLFDPASVGLAIREVDNHQP
jgi:hypothetical protein